jgi:hypothetical protein
VETCTTIKNNLVKIANTLLVTLLILLFSSCSPQINKRIQTSYPPLDSKQEVVILGIDEQAPANAEFLGTLKIGDNLVIAACEYDLVIRQAKIEARRVGGNVIKITEHMLPTAMGSSCHRIKADILRIPDMEQFLEDEREEAPVDIDYALLHVYRYSGYGTWVGYNLMMNDSVLCKVRNHFSEIIRIDKEGLITIWAQTETRSQVTIDFKFGKEYYLRCGIATGTMVGIPVIELVDARIAKAELATINSKVY